MFFMLKTKTPIEDAEHSGGVFILQVLERSIGLAVLLCVDRA